MLKLILAAAVACLVTVSSASAVPASSPVVAIAQFAKPDLVLAQDRRILRRNDAYRSGRVNRWSYTQGRRYNRAPPGWSRYGNRRPGNWRNRRCVQVGPVWFCP